MLSLPYRSLALAAVVLLASCGDETDPVDAGRDAGSVDAGSRGDTGPMNDAGPRDDADTDAGTDAGADAGMPVTQSRVTVYILPGMVVTFDAVDDTGAPLVITAAGAFDHDGMGGESGFVSSGATRHRANGVTGTDLSFVNPVAWVDGSGAALDPDLILSGTLGVGAPGFVGIFGSDARIYDFGTGVYGAAIPITKTDGSPFTPISATTVDLGTGTAIVALEAATSSLWSFDGTAFANVLPVPATCMTGTTIDANLVVGATLAGFPTPLAVDSVILVEGSDAFVLQQITPAVCFSEAVPIVDEAGASLTPEIAYGIDFDDDMDDDLVIIDTVTR